MAAASGVNKQVAYKIESSFGVAPGTSGGQLLRRTSSTIDLNKDAYQSEEIRPDLQLATYRHGVRRVAGSINGELSPKTYSELLGVALKRDFTSLAASTAVSLTIAGTGPTYTVTRAAGSWLTDGYKVGMGIRLSVGSLNAANINKNLFIVDITSATVMTVIPMNGSALVAEGPVAGCTITAIGKRSFVPTTGHTDKSVAIEHWFPETPASELFLGCKFQKVGIQLPPTGIATINFDVMGQDMATQTTQYFSAPTAVTSTDVLAAVNGLVRLGGSTIASLQGLNFDISPKYGGDPVVGSRIIPTMFPGRVVVSGQFTAYFESTTFRDAFVNETELELLTFFTADNTATADFMTFALSRVKVGGAQKNDVDGGIVATFPFQALLNSAGGTGVKSEQTTVFIQDSQAY